MKINLHSEYQLTMANDLYSELKNLSYYIFNLHGKVQRFKIIGNNQL